MEHQLDADEREDERQPGGEIDEPVQQAGDEEEQRAQAEQGEGVGGEDDERLAMMPKTAGIESSAKRMSVLPMASRTRKSGVSTRRPPTRVTQAARRHSGR